MPDEYRHLCAVAFLDVLGWRRLIEQSIFDDALRATMAIALREAGERIVSGPVGEEFPIRSGIPVIRQFSDCIVIAFDLSPGGQASWDSFFYWLHVVCKGLLSRGFLFRGGIAFGDLFLSGNVVFGPALTAAYDLERKTANFPRVITAKRGDVYWLPVPDEYPSNLKEGQDGYPFLDVLRLRSIPWPATADDQREWLGQVRLHLKPKLEDPALEWRDLEKVLWFAEYFNEIAREFGAEEVPIPDTLAIRCHRVRGKLRHIKLQKQKRR